jgi:phosphoribosylformylglycinamidine synthase
VKGMGDACRRFNTPVTGGNVSFYNQSTIDNKTIPVLPTPVIGMLGLLKDKNHQMTMAFKEKGDMIYLIGKSSNDISCSEYLYSWHGVKKSPPPEFNLDFEFNIQEAIKGLINNHLIRSAHDISDGGLFVSLAESAMPRDLGFDITSPAEIRRDAFLFGESQSRVVVSVTQSKETDFIDFLMNMKIPFTALGHVTKGELRVDDLSFGFISDIKKAYFSALDKILEA